MLDGTDSRCVECQRLIPVQTENDILEVDEEADRKSFLRSTALAQIGTLVVVLTGDLPIDASEFMAEYAYFRPSA